MTKGRIIAAIVALLVVAGIVGAIVINQRASVIEVSVQAAERGPFAVLVSTSGTVQASDTAEVYPPAAGTLASVDVTDGQQVKAGDVLGVMDTTLLDLQVAQATAAYEAARAQAASLGATRPSSADERAAAAAVTAAHSAYQAAARQYEFALKGGADPTALTQAQAAVTIANAAYQAADTAYTTFKTTVYDPAPEPKDPALESALEALTTAREEAAGALATAQAALDTLSSAGANPVAVAAAKAARDQAWAAYQAAVSQQAKLASAGSGAVQSSADAGVEAARQALEVAVENRDKAVMRAPIDGTVTLGGGGSLGASSLPGAFGGAAAGGGGTLAAGSAVSPASPAFTVTAFDTLVFEAKVDEADVARIAPGQPVTVTLNAFADQTFTATVERVDRTAVTTATGGTAFTVVCRLTGADDALIGMNGSAEIEVESVDGVLSVPVEAILDEGGTTYVYVIEGGVAQETPVTVGRYTDTRAEIKDGIAAGAKVAVSGIADLSDGAKVRVR